MADVPGRDAPARGAAVVGPRRGASHLRLVWLGTLVCTVSASSVPVCVAAQSSGEDEGAARARVEVHTGLSNLQSSVAGILGGAVFVGLGKRIWLGGAGYASAQVEFADPVRGTSRIGMGYGGLAVEFEIAERDLGIWSAAALVGGGNADASDPVVGIEVGSDNFFVVQSVARLRRPLRGPFGIAGEAGYRRAFGVQDIPGLANSGLSGVTVGISVYAVRR